MTDGLYEVVGAAPGEHWMTVAPAQKMDTPTGLYRWVCTCGGRGGVESETQAVKSGRQHIRDSLDNAGLPFQTRPCEMCGESWKAGEDISPMNGGRAWGHRECLLRMVMGGIGHLRDHNYWCSEMQDPDGGMTYRESALAVDQWVHDHGTFSAADVDDEWIEQCECPVCNPLVKPREKIGMTCPETGLGFIGPQRTEDVADGR